MILERHILNGEKIIYQQYHQGNLSEIVLYFVRPLCLKNKYFFSHRYAPFCMLPAEKDDILIITFADV